MRASDAESNVVTMQCVSRECTMLLDSHCRSSIEVANSPCEVTCARQVLPAYTQSIPINFASSDSDHFLHRKIPG